MLLRLKGADRMYHEVFLLVKELFQRRADAVLDVRMFSKQRFQRCLPRVPAPFMRFNIFR